MRVSQALPAKFLVIAFLVVVALAFLLANRGAYWSFFEADDFDTISWAKAVPITPFVA